MKAISQAQKEKGILGEIFSMKQKYIGFAFDKHMRFERKVKKYKEEQNDNNGVYKEKGKSTTANGKADNKVNEQ